MTKHQNFNYGEAIAETTNNAFNVKEQYKSLPFDGIVEKQKEISLPFAVCCFNVLGCLNTGTIIRSAVLFGAKKVIIFGRRKFDRRSLVGSNNYIEIEYADIDIDPSKPIIDIDEKNFIDIMDKNGYYPVFAESPGVNVNKYDWTRTDGKIPCIVMGNEGYGIDPKLLSLGDVVEIPMPGVLRSFNVGVAAGIIMNSFVASYQK